MRLIDADDVANAIYHHIPSIRTMTDARSIIAEAPSIDIEPKRGEWIALDDTSNGYWKCSVCQTPTEAIGAKELYKFCPFCGADMREREGE